MRLHGAVQLFRIRFRIKRIGATIHRCVQLFSCCCFAALCCDACVPTCTWFCTVGCSASRHTGAFIFILLNESKEEGEEELL